LPWPPSGCSTRGCGGGSRARAASACAASAAQAGGSAWGAGLARRARLGSPALLAATRQPRQTIGGRCDQAASSIKQALLMGKRHVNSVGQLEPCRGC
jgi:hypothetical protein